MTSEKDEYIKLYQTMHATQGKFPGHSIIQHVPDIKSLIKETKAKTLLDYGCGQGKQYTQANAHKQWGGILPTLYDPGVPAYSSKPSGTWDGVVCTDVMEHIPESAVSEILHEIVSCATSFVFFNISTRLASAILPNGQNAHCTVHEHSWWENQITETKAALKSSVIVVLSTKKNKTDHCIRSRV